MFAGTNGAGKKSSVAGATFRQAGADYFNRDEATARILAANPDLSTPEANSAAWHQGKRLLERGRGADAQPAKAAVEVVAPHEADLRVEVIPTVYTFLDKP